MEEEAPPVYNKVILFLIKSNLTTIVTDWQYPFAPSTYYHRKGLLGIEVYVLESREKNKAFYQFLEIRIR